MSPREKGRLLRAAGWKSFAYAGELSWRDPLNPARGTVSTSEAFRTYQGRLADSTPSTPPATKRHHPTRRS